MNLNGKKIILASNSPRRKELLNCLGIDFTIDTGDNFKEYMSHSVPANQLPCIMAEGKSHGFHRSLEEDEILITADTVVILGDEILGKPKDRDDAIRMLKMLSANMHVVVTGVTIRTATSEETFSDSTNVWFKELTDNEIEYYIDNYKPFDKAGAYGTQEWLGLIGIKKIEGSFYNVMGLPVHKLYLELQKFINQ